MTRREIRSGVQDGATIGDAHREAIESACARFRAAGARLVALLHVGGDGRLRTLDFAPRDETHLHAILSHGERADGSSLFPRSGIASSSSDVLLQPRPERAFIDPFAFVPTLCVPCGHGGPDGAPLAVSPDAILRRAADRLEAETGGVLHALGEVEFFLGRPAQAADGDGGAERGYHAASPFVFGEDLRREAIATLMRMGVAVKYAHAEVGWIGPAEANGMIWEQHEIELDLRPLPDAADAIVLARWVVRNIARRAGVQCSFEPVVVEGHAGNGMHVHLSLERDGRPDGVRTADGGLTEDAQRVVAGLVAHGGALMAFGNRAPTSFLRLRQGRETPRAVTWGERDRTALVRLPAVPHDRAGRNAVVPTVELRLPDGAAHPHLLLAAIAQAVTDAYTLPDGELAALLAQADARCTRSAPPRALPTAADDVAAALCMSAPMLEADGIFPPTFTAARADAIAKGW